MNYNEADRRARELVAKMTLEEKIGYIGGTGFTIRPIPRLGIPEIFMADGPFGCKYHGNSACFPGGIAIAATWNREMAREIGAALGRECRARGVHILLAPGVNIYRSPLCGRNFEYLGEDPFLVSDIVVACIEGIQSQEVLATVKHYACNNQEWERHHASSEVDERTLREIYLPAFEAAVKKADSRCLMTSYNLINGIHASEHEYLINEILKEEWGFDGIVMSDWDSVYNAENAANHGLDLEMPYGKFMNRENLIPAIKNGHVKESVIDEKILRILRTCIAAGFFDRPQIKPEIPKDDPESSDVALRGAREAIVLLKNEGNILPLDRSKVKSIAVIGPNAYPAVYCGSGSADPPVFHSVSILEGLQKAAGGSIEVRRTMKEDLGFADGAKMEIFDNRDLKGDPVSVTTVQHIDFDWSSNPAPGLNTTNHFSARWTGKIRPEKAGGYNISVTSDDGMRVYLDGELIHDDWNSHNPITTDLTRALEAREYDVMIEYFQGEAQAAASFRWCPLKTAAQSLDELKDFDAVVFCGGFSHINEGEGKDRKYELPYNQAELISKIAAVNPNMIVVLNSGGGVDWQGWLDKVPAVLHAWYTGQETGRAVAEIIFGDVNPSGKLPATFEARFEDNPTAPYYLINDNLRTPYTEGIYVGYRGYDKNGTKPQFPFGFGLSYTTFEFANLSIAKTGDGIEFSCTVTNTGSRFGAEVAQLYIGDTESSVPRPIRELKGFQKVFLNPGETQTVNFTIGERDLAFYDVDSKSWVTEPGKFTVEIGPSSRDLPLKGEFVW